MWQRNSTKFNTICNAIDKTLSCFEQDAHLKIHFAGSESEFPPTRLYNKSTYRAPLPPYNIGTCFSNFELSLCTLVKQHKGCPNFSNFKKQVFNDLLANDTIVYAHSDKNLGPVAIELTQYIKDGLKHLTNTSTYMLLTKAEALQEDKELQKQILQWCTDPLNWIPKYVPPDLWKKLTETAKDPFGYLYLLYKIHKPGLTTCPVCSDCASTPHALG